MFSRQSQFTELVLELYRGAVSDEAWARSLDVISDVLGGSAIFLGSLGPNGHSSMIGHRIDPESAALVGGPLATPEANPFISAMAAAPIGKAVPTTVMCGDAVLVRSPVYQAALRPFGQRYVLGAMLERVGPTSRTIALTRASASGDYLDADVEFLDELLPHLARAIHIRGEFAAVRSESLAALTALDEIPRGIVILRPDQTLAFANREARRIFSMHDGLCATSSGFWASDSVVAGLLRKALKSAANELSTAFGAMPMPIAVPRPSGRAPYAVSLSLGPAVDSGVQVIPERVSITVSIIDPDRQSSPSISVLRTVYGLTLMEAKLAAALCDVDLGQAARDLGISINTAKTHLQAVFQKVGVSRQAALVRRVTLDLGI